MDDDRVLIMFVDLLAHHSPAKYATNQCMGTVDIEILWRLCHLNQLSFSELPTPQLEFNIWRR